MRQRPPSPAHGRVVVKVAAHPRVRRVERRSEPRRLIERTGLPRSTLHRLVKVLVDERFLVRSSQSRYRCTLKLWRIGAMSADYDHVGERVQPVLRASRSRPARPPITQCTRTGGVFTSRSPTPTTRCARGHRWAVGRRRTRARPERRSRVARRDGDPPRRRPRAALHAEHHRGADGSRREAERVRGLGTRSAAASGTRSSGRWQRRS